MEGSPSNARSLSPQRDGFGDGKGNDNISKVQDVATASETEEVDDNESLISIDSKLQKKLVRKIDLRLCTIAGILCSLNLLDSGIISSASVTRSVTLLVTFGILLGFALSQETWSDVDRLLVSFRILVWVLGIDT